MKMKRMSLPWFAALLAWAPVSAFSTLLYYDGFPTSGADAYAVDRVANGSNPQHSSIVGFKDDAANTWRTGSTAIRISANNLVPPADVKLATQDGCFSVGEGSGSPRSGFRNIVSPALSGTTYYSFLVRYKGAFPSALTWDYVAFDTVGWSGTTSAQLDWFGTNGFVVAFVRQDAGTVNLVFKTDTATHNLVPNAAAETTYMVAVKYVNNPGAAHVVQAGVIAGPEEPETWDVSVTTPVRSKTIDKMCIGGYGANSTVNCFLFDEVRIGTTFQDVAGVAGMEPAVFSESTSVGDIAVGGGFGSATISGTLSDPGDPVADLYLYWGLADGGASDLATWANTGFVAQAAAATFSTNVTALPRDSMVFYRLAAVTPAQTIWGVPEPAAFLTAPLAVASPAPVAENALAPASFVISRPDADAACTADLLVNFTLGGTARPGVHYTASSSGSVVIPAASSNASVFIQPKPDFVSEDDVTVALVVEPGAYAASTAATGLLTIVNAPLPAAPTNAFIGAVSDLASTAGNWSLGRVPAAADDILFSPSYALRNLTWDAAAPRTVASWNQPAGITNTVFFETTLDAPLRILGNAELHGGVWTHVGPSNAPAHAVAVDVDGDLSVGANAAINVGRDVSGIDPTGVARGFHRAGPGYLQGTGSSYGGEGFTNAVTYGSVVNPLSYGSSAHGSGGANALLKYAGGGLVRLRVGGTLAVSGKIAADGYGYANNGGGGTGGTLNLEAGKLVGGGDITANGGNDTYYGSGSGGRIRIKLTDADARFADFTGALTAHGGTGGAPGASAQYDSAGAAAGTIALQTPDTGAQMTRVIVRNHDNWRAQTNAVSRFFPSTHLPPTQLTDASLSYTDWVLGDNAHVRVTKNVSINSLAMLPAVSGNAVNPVLFLNGSTLMVKALEIDGEHYPPGAYQAGDFPAGWVSDSGSVIVQGRATLICLK
ncbi:MAG: hypothetical protein ACOX9C_12900 [Kiritimatiellia bacterium]|jgi:hypothetical protein